MLQIINTEAQVKDGEVWLKTARKEEGELKESVSKLTAALSDEPSLTAADYWHVLCIFWVILNLVP